MARLPQINFKPVIAPYVESPIQELGAATKVLRQDYEEGIAIDDRSRQAIAAARASAPKDQEVLDRYNQELISTLDQARESGDYERQKSTLKKALSSYAGRVTPIMERNQMFDNFAQQAIQTGSDPSRVLKAMYNEEAKNPTLVEQDGYVFNRLRPTDAAKFIAPNVNLTEEFGNISKLAQEEIRNSISTGQMTAKMSPEGDYTFPVMINGDERYVEESKVRPLIESRMNETDIQRYLDAERNLLMSGEDLSREEADAKLKQRLDEATNSVVGATTYRNITKNVSQINVPQSSEGSGGRGKYTPGLITPRRKGTSINVSDNIKSLSDLRTARANIDTQISQASTPQEVVSLQLRKERYEAVNDYITEKLPEIFKNKNISPDNQRLLAEYASYSDEMINKELNRSSAYAGTGTPTGLASSKILENSEIRKVKELRESVSKETQQELSSLLNINSLTPNVEQLSFSKNKDTDKTTRDELKGFIQDDIESYDFIFQNNKTLEENLDQMTEDQREKFKELTGKEATASTIFGELNIDGYSSVPINGVPAITGRLSTSLNELFGTDVYVIPKLGVDSRLYEYMTKRGVSDPVMQGLVKMGSSGNYAEPYFQEMILTNPALMKDNDKIQFSSELPTIDYKKEEYKDSKGNIQYRIKYKIDTPDGKDTTGFQTARDFIEIRDNYYQIINGLYE